MSRISGRGLGSKLSSFFVALGVTLAWTGGAGAQSTVTIGVGTQDTTTNTVTTGVIIKQLKLLEKHLPKDGKYAKIKFEFEWNNFTSGPPVTNGMMANKLQFGAMGDYPLIVNGFTFQSNPESKSRLIAVAAYNKYGSGNGLVVHKDSNYFQLSDLKGKVVSVPFGSAAHGMVLKAMQDKGWPADYFQLVSQSPEVGSTNLQEKKIDAHADFVPFAELLPFRGFARKIFDGVETNQPTWHGVVVRTDFAEKYPEVVVAYIKAIVDANAWFRADPKKAGEVWSDDGIEPFSSTACTLGAYASLKAKGKKINMAYVFDTPRGIKLFADQAFFAVGGSEIAPFLLKKDAEAHAAKIGGKVVNFNDALKSAMSGG